MLNQNRVDIARLCDIDLDAMTIIEDKNVREQYHTARDWNAMPENTDEEKKLKLRSHFESGVILLGKRKFEDAINLDEDSFVKKYVAHPLAFHSIVDN